MSKRMSRKPVKSTRKNRAAATMSPAMQAAIREHPPAPNRPLIGTKDWAAEALAEVAAMKAQNFAKELEALEKRNRK